MGYANYEHSTENIEERALTLEMQHVDTWALKLRQINTNVAQNQKNNFLLFEIGSFAVKEIAVVRKWRQNVRPVKISTTHNIWNANAFGSGSLACFLHFFLESFMIFCWTMFF